MIERSRMTPYYKKLSYWLHTALKSANNAA